MPIHSLSLFLGAIIILTFGVALLLKRKTPDNVAGISILVATVAIWTLAYLIHTINETYISLKILKSINYLCLSTAASAQLLFAFSYSHRTRWLTTTTYIIFLIEPILIQIFFWMEPLKASSIILENGFLHQVNLTYISCILAVSIFLFTETFLSKPSPHFAGAWTILMGAFFPLISNLLIFVIQGDLDTHIFLSSFSYSLAIASFSYGMFNNNLVEVMPLTRDAVIEGMDDGWMVVDHQDKVIDVNSSAEIIIGMSRENIYGLPVAQILSEWPKVLQSSDGVKEIEMRRTTKSKSERQYLNLRISQLINKNNLQFGHLIVWRDITGRKRIDAIHQSARDELFVLLNAISSLASRTMNLEDFLSESSYQILYSFHSQAIAVFLTEENDSSQQKLSLKSHFGFPPEYVNTINSKTIATNIHDWLIKNEANRPLILNSMRKSVTIPFHPPAIGFNYVTLIPLIIYSQHEKSMQGCLCLGRNEDTVYSQDEVIRLTTIANQIATLIDSNRRRQFAIALSERQRLLRDLHDSVSQKLYGLVALTEAAQAGIEAGSKIAAVDVLSRIGENARQAVKEMRLFLYEMQPVDLKDGLVSSLQHRLAAVEGRADIKARMISDENIELDKDNEIALYYIAQEALNNILRHAHAKNVSANLRQTRHNVILEITDDGQGFDIKKLDNSGLGLRNMKERAAQAKGKIRITSKIGVGTKIVVSVARKGIL
jgi:PAS domain S-box-containing protein